MCEQSIPLGMIYTIEVEVTNFCNAKCVFCANKELKRPRGFLQVDAFKRFIEQIVELKEKNIFKKYHIYKYPRITFCGLGEPLLHPNIVQLVKIAHDTGLYTQLVTNGHCLTPEKLQSLIEAGLDELAISFHSINEVNYRSITNLDVYDLQKALIHCKSIFRSAKLKISIWRIKHPDPRIKDSNEDEIKFQRFINEICLSECEILGPSEPWSRDGYVPMSKCEKTNDFPFWCNKIVFTLNIDWQGNLVICCNDYNCEHLTLGNVFDDHFSFNGYIERKMDILFKKEIPELCERCRRWPDNEIISILENENIDKISFFESLKIDFGL